MDESETEADLHALRTIRRRLTVALLAVEQLCRTVATLPAAQRLCSFATDALSDMKDEVVGLEARVLRRERRNHVPPDEIPGHPPDP